MIFLWCSFSIESDILFLAISNSVFSHCLARYIDHDAKNLFWQELYHEYHALDRFEQLYLLKLEEVESLHLSRKGVQPTTFLMCICYMWVCSI